MTHTYDQCMFQKRRRRNGYRVTNPILPVWTFPLRPPLYFCQDEAEESTSCMLSECLMVLHPVKRVEMHHPVIFVSTQSEANSLDKDPTLLPLWLAGSTISVLIGWPPAFYLFHYLLVYSSAMQNSSEEKNSSPKSVQKSICSFKQTQQPSTYYILKQNSQTVHGNCVVILHIIYIYILTWFLQIFSECSCGIYWQFLIV